MKNIFSKVFSLIKRRWILFSAILLVLIIALFLYFGRNKASVSTVSVKRGSVISTVSVTGVVKSSQSIDLSFLQSGRISKINVSVGDKVYSGEVLASLANFDLAAQVAQAEANVKAQQAKLNELLQGTRPEQLKSKEYELKQAKVILLGYQNDAINAISDAYTKAEDAIRNKTDELFSNDGKNTFYSANGQALLDAQNLRIVVKNELDLWRKELSDLSLSSNSQLINDALINAQKRLTTLRSFLQKTSDALDAAIGLSASTLSTYKANVNSARSNIDVALSNITNKQQLIASQELNISRIESDYNLLLAGPTAQQIEAQRAQLEQAKANALYQQAVYEKTILRAPFDGVVTRVVHSAGDVVSSNDVILSLNSNGKYQIEANVAESDVSKVKVGKEAEVTLDAYGSSVVFKAKVIKMDLSATILDGVATYKTVLQFESNDSKILPGLTANVVIFSDKRDDVLYVPTRNIISDESGNYVMLVSDSKGSNPKKVKIEVGLVGSDGRTEVVSGLSEGQLILVE
jgi:HlyD family secretion protein